MSRWLVTGASGTLGRDLVRMLDLAGEDCLGFGRNRLDRDGLDITSPAAVRDTLLSYRPDVVVNCAAWTSVDAAEANEEAALAVNGTAVAGLASACRDIGAVMVQVSTEYVFDGTARSPYREDHLPAPRTAYGRTKLAGEQAVLSALPDAAYIVRTAWLYSAHRRGFVGAMLDRARAGMPSSVVDDQRGQPTWTRDVATRIHALVSAKAPPGIYHATSSGEATWYGLARSVYQLAAADPFLVQPVGADAYPHSALRPRYSVLGHNAWATVGISPISNWRDALRRAYPAVAELTSHTG